MWQPEVWVEDIELEVGPDDEVSPALSPAPAPPKRARGRDGQPGGDAGSQVAARAGRTRRKLPEDVSTELEHAAGARQASKLADRLADASRAYERERYEDARRTLKPLVDLAPDSAAVRELLGLTEYRRGRWREAVKHLEAFRSLSGSVEQHPVLADCYRALRRHRQVDALWEELRAASPSAELVTEGRIVAAGSLADRGDVQGAITLLEKGRVDRKHPKDHHLRQWYALADLYERAGDIPRARDLFGRVAAVDPDAYDVAERLRTLR